MEKTKKKGSNNHTFLVANYLIGYLLLAGMFYWAGLIWWGHIAIGLWIISLAVYWIYGIDYYKVDWLLDLKYGKDRQ